MFDQVAQADSYLDNPDIDDKTKLERLRKQFDEYRFFTNFHDNPRDKYQNFLLAAKQSDVANVDKFIIEEIERMKAELER